ncbi:MAG: IS21 family transposase [Pedobacter sp.]|nr:MAG: IS21 family transposase [Pedobacter sp.]
MSNKVISMQQIRALIQLLEQGMSLRAIAAELRLSRQPVTLYTARLRSAFCSLQELRQLPDAELAKIVYPPAPADSLSDSERRKDINTRMAYFLTELKRTGVTRLLLWEEYRKECTDPYQYTQFCILLKEASKTSKATMHLVHAPAAMMMVDFAGDKMSYVDRLTGEVILCPVLVVVLPFSKYTFVMALPDATIPQVIKALTACLHFLGGTPLSLKTDNMKQVVTKSCRYEPLFTEALQGWAQHYNITLLATRVAKPQDKGAVENEVKIAYQRIYAPLRDTIFYSIDELNLAIRTQGTRHNEKLFQLKDHSRLELFEKEERSLLNALPANPFELKHQVLAKVQKNYHITLGENYHHYSVPYQFIAKQVSAVYDTDIVEIYYQHQRIALHRRSFKKHGFTTVAEHMPAGHQQFYQQQGWTPAYFLNQAMRIGPAVHRYIDEVLKARAFTEQTYNACRGILRLHNQYGSQRLEAACIRALSGQVFNYRTLQNILASNLDQDIDSPPQDLFRTPDHPNLRGPQSYQ